jgi:hypothetical protein
VRLLSEVGSPLIRASLDSGSIMSAMGLTPPPTQYAQSGEVHVAYQVTGSGEIDVVFAPGTVSHLGLDLEWPEWVTETERLSVG